MKEVIIHAYETSDGKQFATEEEAQQHQDSLDFTKTYLVHYNFDLTEGRGYFDKGLVIVTCKENHDQVIQDYCYSKFGNRIGYVMGRVSRNSEVDLWTYREVTDLKKRDDLKVLATISK